MTTQPKVQSVQVFGRKRSAVAIAYTKAGKGLIKINGTPIEFVQPEGLRFKVMEPIILLGFPKFENVDIRIRVNGGGFTSRVYAIRQAIAKSLVAYYQKCMYLLWPQKCNIDPSPSSLPYPLYQTGTDETNKKKFEI